jgi:hypothetical protein
LTRYPDSIRDMSRNLTKILAGWMSSIIVSYDKGLINHVLAKNTRVDNVLLVSEIKGQYKLDCEAAHDGVRDHAVFEPCPEAPQCLSHNLEHETHVDSVGAFVLEIVDEMANVFVAHQPPVSITKMR